MRLDQARIVVENETIQIKFTVCCSDYHMQEADCDIKLALIANQSDEEHISASMDCHYLFVLI